MPNWTGVGGSSGSSGPFSISGLLVDMGSAGLLRTGDLRRPARRKGSTGSWTSITGRGIFWLISSFEGSTGLRTTSLPGVRDIRRGGAARPPRAERVIRPSVTGCSMLGTADWCSVPSTP
jgi:hypothetical protein